MFCGLLVCLLVFASSFRVPGYVRACWDILGYAVSVCLFSHGLLICLLGHAGICSAMLLGAWDMLGCVRLCWDMLATSMC